MPLSTIKKDYELMFTGFIGLYGDGSKIMEKEHFLDSRGKIRATNWSEVDKKRLTRLELYWRGKLKAAVSENEVTSKGTWIFYQTGCVDNSGSVILSRTIGYKNLSKIYLYTVDEKTGKIIY